MKYLCKFSKFSSHTYFSKFWRYHLTFNNSLDSEVPSFKHYQIFGILVWTQAENGVTKRVK